MGHSCFLDATQPRQWFEGFSMRWAVRQKKDQMQ